MITMIDGIEVEYSQDTARRCVAFVDALAVDDVPP